MAKVILATGMIVGYGYGIEAFTAWYSGNPYEEFMLLGKGRPFGPYAYGYWFMLACNVGVPQFLWLPAIRRNAWALWVISILVNVGMWLERYVIVVTSLSQDFVPSSWALYSGTFWDWATYIGTIGLFMFLLFLFIRFLPVIAIAEMRELVHETHERAGGGHVHSSAEGHGDAR
jgi:molybdopterin-containing oxidoreductase family membrane subunit